MNLEATIQTLTSLLSEVIHEINLKTSELRRKKTNSNLVFLETTTWYKARNVRAYELLYRIYLRFAPSY